MSNDESWKRKKRKKTNDTIHNKLMFCFLFLQTHLEFEVEILKGARTHYRLEHNIFF